jgi:hypothetical protein
LATGSSVVEGRAFDRNNNEIHARRVQGVLNGRSIYVVVDTPTFTRDFSGTIDDQGWASGPGWQGAPALRCVSSAQEAPPAEAPAAVAPAPEAAPKSAIVVADVDVYNAKNEPDGAGQVIGILRAGQQVTLVGDCAPSSWCEVVSEFIPGQDVVWVWGHLQLP